MIEYNRKAVGLRRKEELRRGKVKCRSAKDSSGHHHGVGRP